MKPFGPVFHEVSQDMTLRTSDMTLRSTLRTSDMTLRSTLQTGPEMASDP